MAIINLTEQQMQELQIEIDKCEKAYEDGKKGMLILQVWPAAMSAEGGFISHDLSKKILEITEDYRR